MQQLNFLVAFGSGVVSFFAPCVVPLLPAYVGYVSGVSLVELQKKGGMKRYRKKIILSSLIYMLGFAMVFVILGTTAASLGAALRQYDVFIQRAGGILVMLFALSFMGLFKLPLPVNLQQVKLPKWAERLGYGRSFLVGVVFATAWTPCVGAVLGAILTLAATTGTAGTGALLLLVYSLGISIPFMLISLMIAQAPAVLKLITRYLNGVTKLAGLLLFIIGFLLFNNTVGWINSDLTYNRLNSWLFEIAFRLGYQIR